MGPQRLSGQLSHGKHPRHVALIGRIVARHIHHHGHALLQPGAVRPQRQAGILPRTAERKIERRRLLGIGSRQQTAHEDLHIDAVRMEDAAGTVQAHQPLDLDLQFQVGHPRPVTGGDHPVHLRLAAGRQPHLFNLPGGLDHPQPTQQL